MQSDSIVLARAIDKEFGELSTKSPSPIIGIDHENVNVFQAQTKGHWQIWRIRYQNEQRTVFLAIFDKANIAQKGSSDWRRSMATPRRTCLLTTSNKCGESVIAF